jgi:solute carrier family 25 oxoglutarate transporter 11
MLLKTRKFTKTTIAASLAAASVQPLDTLKVKIQANSEKIALGDEKASTNPFAIIRRTIQKKGSFALGVKSYYKGLGSALLRQITYGTAKFGLYLYFADLVRNRKGGSIFNYSFF